MSLQRHSHLALHEQLADELRRQIRTMNDGDRLPTEGELSETYGLSRTTIRKAIQALVEESLVVRRRGKGSFVASPPLTYALDRVGAFTDTFTTQGLKPESQILSFRWIDDPIELPPEMDGEPEAALFAARLYQLDGEPKALAHMYFPNKFGAAIRRTDIEKHPAFQIIEEKLQVPIGRGRIAIRGSSCPSEIAEVLQLSESSPILLLHRWIHSTGGQLVQYSVHYLPFNEFQFNLETAAMSEEQSYSFPSIAHHLQPSGQPTEGTMTISGF